MSASVPSKMKTALSVSLGSKDRDFERIIQLNGVNILVKRIGVDGSLDEMRRILTLYDGKVDAISIGGCNFSICFNGSEWTFREFEFIKNDCVKHTPVTDGAVVRRVIETTAYDVFKENESIIFETPIKHNMCTVLVTVVVDRVDLAMPFIQAGYSMIYGDFMFGLDISVAIRSWWLVKAVAYIMIPIATKLIPFAWLYPTGESQSKHEPKWMSIYEESDVILSDSHYVTTTSASLKGKCLITNTVNESDVEKFKKWGLRSLITTTPNIDGRSFGTNALEAAIIAASGLKRNLTVGEMKEFVKSNPILKPKLRLLSVDNDHSTSMDKFVKHERQSQIWLFIYCAFFGVGVLYMMSWLGIIIQK